MKDWFFRAVAVICLLLVSFWSGVAGMMFSDRQPPVTVTNRRVLTPEVDAGGRLMIEYTFRRDRACRTHVDRMIIDADSTRHILPDLDYEATGDTGEEKVVSQVGVPINIANGPAKYRTVVSYACNMVHRLLWPIVVINPDTSFTVRGALRKESALETPTLSIKEVLRSGGDDLLLPQISRDTGISLVSR